MAANPAAPTVDMLLKYAMTQLHGVSDSVRLDSELLLAAALGRTREWLTAWPDEVVDGVGQRRFLELLARRQRGTPIAHLTGSREFWSLPLAVTPATLIPRPETETLVEAALARIPAAQDSTIADLGTGSGAIALALATERPRALITATDISECALAVARRNARSLGIDNVRFIASDWFDALAGERFDVAVSNPPYVPNGDPHLDEGDVAHEPRLALTAGPDGLEAIRHIAKQAPRHLVRAGWLLIEHGYDQHDAVRALLLAAGYRDIETLMDLAGVRRGIAARAPE